MTDREVISKDGSRFFLDNVEVTEAEYRKVYPLPEIGSGIPGGTTLTGWPIFSDAVGVHPKRRAEHEEVCNRKGVPTETRRDGRVVFRNRAHRRQYLKAFGYHDNDGGYSD